MRTIAAMPSGPLDLEVSSWRRVWRTFRVENLMGDIVKFEGGSDEVGPLGRPACRWRQRLTQKDWSWIKEWWKRSQSCFLVEGNIMIGTSFGRQLWP